MMLLAFSRIDTEGIFENAHKPEEADLSPTAPQPFHQNTELLLYFEIILRIDLLLRMLTLNTNAHFMLHAAIFFFISETCA